MNLGKTCLIAAALMALTGMAMGFYMAAVQDFTLAPAHAHLNLVGWVTMAIYGLYHRSQRGASGRLRWVQAIAGALGPPAMAGGLALLLTSPAGSELHKRGEVTVIAGSVLAMLSMVLFVVVVGRDRVRGGGPGAGASSHQDGAQLEGSS
ncbi:hypothetical protein [Phenylobacterium deserti]|uniref:Cytochrome-c oxidase n=1 Tax=Phenylobacterium deserti TaxID=1914756 RepID=A0A328AT23_9CAUL|nr:hypothetical protein [Phenylobacterium deserti]RAK57415.1 hypothetical protein DJ018_05600 [Phenylobacterium deserti]